MYHIIQILLIHHKLLVYQLVKNKLIKMVIVVMHFLIY